MLAFVSWKFPLFDAIQTLHENGHFLRRLFVTLCGRRRDTVLICFACRTGIIRPRQRFAEYLPRRRITGILKDGRAQVNNGVRVVVQFQILIAERESQQRIVFSASQHCFETIDDAHGAGEG